MNLNMSRNQGSRNVCVRWKGTTTLGIIAICLPNLAIAQALMQLPGAEVTAEDVRAVAARMQEPSRYTTLSREGNVQRLAEDILLRRYLATQAEKADLGKDAVVQAQLRQARERVLSDARLTAVEDAAHPGAAALTRYALEVYRADPSKFQTGEQWRARHILIGPAPGRNARERAELVKGEAAKGVPFDTLAKQYSDDKATAAVGGDLGWFVKGTMVKEFQAAVESLKAAGDVSDIIESSFGLHIIRLEAKRAAGQRSFEEVRQELERDLLAKRQNDAKQELVRTILKDAKADPVAIQAVAQSYTRP